MGKRHRKSAGASRIAGACLIVVGLGPGIARAQGNAFLPPAGGATIAISQTFEYYDEFWMGNTEVSDPGLGRVETGSATLWMQAGLSANFALAANFAYVDVRTDGAGGLQAQGLQDRGLLLRYRFLNHERNGWRHSLVAGAGLRMPASGYDPDTPVALGDGTTDGLFRLVYQIQADFFWGTYLAVEGGYDARDSSAPDGSSVSAELGATVNRLSVSVSALGCWADGGSDIGDPGFTFPGLNEDRFQLAGKLYYRVSPEFGLAVSAFTTPDGRNTGRSKGVSTSLVVNL